MPMRATMMNTIRSATMVGLLCICAPGKPGAQEVAVADSSAKQPLTVTPDFAGDAWVDAGWRVSALDLLGREMSRTDWQTIAPQRNP